ncbi:MAG: hypothetical protein ACI30S_06755 [Muribaculaceae bacterium]
MNNTITLLALCKQLQEKLPYGIESEQFIASFISTIYKALAKDGSVTIIGLGQFILLKSDSLDEKGNVDAIRFIPDSELADTVNQPFAFFDAVELEDEVTDDELINNNNINNIEATSDKLQENDSQDNVALTNEDKLNSSGNNEIDSALEEIFDEDIEQPESQSSCDSSMHAVDHKKTDVEEATDNIPFEVTITDNQNGSDVDNSTTNTEQQETDSFDNPFKVEGYATDDESENDNNSPEKNEQYNNDKEKEENSNMSWLWLVIFFVLGLVIGCCIPAFISNPTVVEEVFIYDTIYVDKPIVKDSIDISSTKPEVQESSLTQKVEVQTNTSQNRSENVESQSDKNDAIITETVKPNNTLISMALRHYGHRDFWAYIYIENQDKLGNPDMVRSGQVLVIPPASKYGIDKNSKESVEKANKKCKEILNKYKK